MTQQQHTFTPPPELVQQWTDEIYGGPGVVAASDDICLAKLAAQWGADQELEACCLLMDDWGLEASDLRSARRPSRHTLARIALQMLGTIERDAHYLPEITNTIRRALEALPE